ncbi:hypothetical protein B0H12DRAFT_1075475 [Mycena haematopus]|nr:hypothetical protein B0H12DRAFT_1075475 [Mycena haematopus]
MFSTWAGHSIRYTAGMVQGPQQTRKRAPEELGTTNGRRHRCCPGTNKETGHKLLLLARNKLKHTEQTTGDKPETANWELETANRELGTTNTFLQRTCRQQKRKYGHQRNWERPMGAERWETRSKPPQTTTNKGTTNKMLGLGTTYRKLGTKFE